MRGPPMTAQPRPLAAATLAAALVVSAATPARADAIDGRWCSADNRDLTIRGPDIVTPEGVAMKGDYDRHGFRYQRPGGPVVEMALLSETTMNLRPAPDRPVEVWRRCAAKPVS